MEGESSVYQDDQMDPVVKTEEVSQPVYLQNNFGVQQFINAVDIPQETIDPNDISQPMYLDNARSVVDENADFNLFVPLDSDVSVNEPNSISTVYPCENLNMEDSLAQYITPITIEPDPVKEEDVEIEEKNYGENTVETNLLHVIEPGAYPAKEELMDQCNFDSVSKPTRVIDEVCPLHAVNSIKQEPVDECSAIVGHITDGNVSDTKIFAEYDTLLAQTRELTVYTEGMIKTELKSECKDAQNSSLCNSNGYPTIGDMLGSVQIHFDTMQEDIKSEQKNETCLNCEKKCRIRERLQDYLYVDQKGQIHCVDCLASFKLTFDALSHAFQQHRGCYITEKDAVNRIFWCPMCSYSCKCHNNLDLHIKNHPNLRYKCPKVGCDRVFEGPTKLRNHLRNHREPEAPPSGYLCAFCYSDARGRRMKRFDLWTKKTEQTYQCSLCAELFETKVKQCKHILHEHKGSIDESFICPQCFRLFQNLSERNFHVQTHEKMKHKCMYCGWVYRYQSELLEHTRNDHTKRERQCTTFAYEIQCGKCPRSFPSLDTLNAHLRTHEQPTCSKCGKTFRTEQLLKKHDMFVHDERKPYLGSQSCTMCPRTFSSRKSFDKHMVEHNSGALRHRCPNKGCRMVFKSFALLNTHVIRAHNSCMKCARCHMELSSRLIYEKHIGQCAVLFKCDECTEKFGTRNELDEHSSIHNALKETNKELIKVHHGAFNVVCASDELRATHSKTHHENSSGNIKNSPFFAKDKCSLCLGSVQYKTSVEEYIVRDSDEFQCVECLEKFKSHGSALWHALSRHNGILYSENGSSRLFECFICSRQLRSKAFEYHVKAHDKLNATCLVPECTWMFYRSGNDLVQYKMHSKVCGSAENKKRAENVMCPKCFLLTRSMYKKRYLCSKCTGSFDTKSERLRHWNTAHAYKAFAKDVSASCPLCARQFPSKAKVKDHIKAHNTMTAECPKCGWQFSGYNQCISHLKSRHGDRSSSPVQMLGRASRIKYECPHCRYVYPNQKALEYHVKVKHELRRPARSCSQCGRNFKQPKDLELHMSNHSLMVHKCPLCGCAFEKLGKLESHVKWKHVNKKKHTTRMVNANPVRLERFPCVNCKEQYSSQAALKEHYLRKHDKSFKCLRCTRGFGTAELLESHTRSRHPKRNVQMKSSVRKESTGKRKPTSKNKNYVCRICNTSFEDMKSFYIHTKNFHSDTSAEKQTENVNVSFQPPSVAERQATNCGESDIKTESTGENENYYVCGKCDMSFNEVKAFYTHAQTMHSETYAQKPYTHAQTMHSETYAQKPEQNLKSALNKLAKCEYGTFHQKDTYLTKSPSKDPVIHIKCSECKQIFKDMKLFYNHVKTAHHKDTSTQEPTANIADDEKSENEDIQSDFHSDSVIHSDTQNKSHVESLDVQYKCTDCTMHFEDMKSFCMHAKSVHFNVPIQSQDKSLDLQYKCTECRQPFKDMETFCLHAKSCLMSSNAVHDEPSQTIVDVTKIESEDVQRGPDSHEGHNMKSKWVDHSNNISQNSSHPSLADLLKHDRMFRCVRCRKLFPDAESLYQHGKTKHSQNAGETNITYENTVESNAAKYPVRYRCTKCRQPFVDIRSFKLHAKSCMMPCNAGAREGLGREIIVHQRGNEKEDHGSGPQTQEVQSVNKPNESLNYPQDSIQGQSSDEGSDSEVEPGEEREQIHDEIRNATELKTSAVSDSIGFKCELCEEEFIYEGLLINHVISEHKWEERQKSIESDHNMILLRTPVVVLKRLSDSVLRRYGCSSSKRPRRN